MKYRSFFHALLRNVPEQEALSDRLATAVEHAVDIQNQLAELDDEILDLKQQHAEELQDMEDRRVLIQKNCSHIDCEDHVCTVCGLNIFSGR